MSASTTQGGHNQILVSESCPRTTEHTDNNAKSNDKIIYSDALKTKNLFISLRLSPKQFLTNYN